MTNLPFRHSCVDKPIEKQRFLSPCKDPAALIPPGFLLYQGLVYRAQNPMKLQRLLNLKTTLLVLTTSLLLAGCSSSKSLLDSMFAGKSSEDEAVSADAQLNDTAIAALYNDGITQLNSGNFKTATKKFGEVERRYPYSRWATKSLLMQGYANYRARSYDDATNALKRFISLHPGHRDTPYAYYLVALSEYEQIGIVERDQSQTERAYEALTEVERRFPDSKYAPDARKKALLARDRLAAKEMEVGRYYLNRSSHLAAINRFKRVVTEFQTTSHTPEALYRLTESYMAMGVTSEAQTAAAVLGHNFPKSTWYRDAYQLVSSGGQQPVENEGSWISRAFRRFAG
jgi:outer membrane protein assembly factor BamD